MVVVVDIVDVVVVEVVVEAVLGSVVVTFSVVAGGDVESLGTGRLISSPESNLGLNSESKSFN